METQYVPAILSEAPDGTVYARIAPTSFPVGADGYLDRAASAHRLQKGRAVG